MGGKVTPEAALPPPSESLFARLGNAVADAAQAIATGTLELGYDVADQFLPEPVKDFGLTVAEHGVGALTAASRFVLGEDAEVSRLLGDLSRVDFEGIRRRDALRADWFKLTRTWFFEGKPPELGAWSKDPDGVDRLTLTRPDYTADLASKPTFKQAAQALRARSPLSPGDSVTASFEFTGPGSASGEYDALEWFLGSYDLTLTVEDVDAQTGKVRVRAEVENRSNWESATRVPESFQAHGWPGSLFHDAKRSDHGLGGNFRQTFRWWEEWPPQAEDSAASAGS